MMREIDVTLTDYGLAIECALLAISLGRSSGHDVTVKWAGAGFFAFMGLSAALGGTVHGFCPDLTSTACQVLWQLTLQAIGLSALSIWIVGTALIVRGRGRRFLEGLGVSMLLAYSPAALLVTQQFWIAFTIYLPAAVLLLAGFFVSARRAPRPAAVGAAGSLLSFLSSAIQMAKVGLHPSYFNHNALAHVAQAVALWFMFRGIEGLSQRAGADETGAAVREVPTP